MKTYQTGEQALTHTEYQLMKAIAKGLITSKAGDSARWRDELKHVVTSTVQPLLERGILRADPTFTNGRRGLHITQAGYAAMSYAARHKPVKRGH